MESNAPNRGQDVRYEPDERPPLPLTLGLGLQYAVLTVTSVVLTPAILIGAVGGGDAYLSWVVFAALLVSGVTTVIQVVRVGRMGSGYLLLMGTGSAFLAICLAALEAAWIGLPALAWPGIDLGFGADFWALLPAFVLLTLVGAMDTIGDCIAISASPGGVRAPSTSSRFRARWPPTAWATCCPA